VLPAQVEEANIIENWLRQKRGNSVQIRVPKPDGPDANLIDLARQNAQEQLATLRAQWQEDSLRQEAVLKELQESLDLPRLPTRVECYDISNTQGTAIVGSMVVFVHGVPKKGDYRRFNIKGIDGPNDFESMRQTLTRRFQRWRDAQADGEGDGLKEEDGIDDGQADARPADAPTPAHHPAQSRQPGRKEDPSWALLPDLVLIDGGRGQLGIAVEVLKQFDLAHIVPVVSLAKQKEEIFVPGKAESILLPRNSQSFFLVQRIRDEAHRYGITSHRRQREKIGMASRLDALDGIGPVRRKRLLTHFGSIEAIHEASVEELAKVVPKAVARSIKDGLGG
jgi:excinuclease ABC subunit C